MQNLQDTIFGFVYLDSSSGQVSYKFLQDKPSINGYELNGDTTLQQIGIIVATNDSVGLIKGSDAANSVSVAADGTVSVNSIDYNRINISENDLQVVYRKTFSEFPSYGREGVLYLATGDHKLYMWNEEELKYISIVTETEPVSIIDGGSAFNATK